MMQMRDMRFALASLLRNLIAGARLSLFMPVTRLAFRIDLAQLLLLFIFSAAIDVAGDWFKTGPARQFSLYGAGTELYTGGLLLLVSTVLALMFRQRTLALAIPLIVLASVPIVQVLNFLLPYLNGDSAVRSFGLELGGRLLVLWMVAILVRSIAVAFAPPTCRRVADAGWKGAAGGTDLAFQQPRSERTLVARPGLAHRNAGRHVGGIRGSARYAELPARTCALRPGGRAAGTDRPLLRRLRTLRARGRLPQRRRGCPARDERRWNTSGRSLLLINNPQTLLTTPFATITNSARP
jgi:hypothetical protein